MKNWIALFALAVGPSGMSDSNRDAVLRAPDRYAAGRAYETFFCRQSTKELAALRNDANVAIALQAAWEVSHHPVKRHDKFTNWNWVYDPAGTQGFLDFFAQRTSVPIPSWWSATIRNTEMAPGQGSACFGPFSRKAPTLQIRGGRATISVGSNRLDLPVGSIDVSDTVASDASMDSENAYVAMIPLAGVGKLYCVDRHSGQRLWVSEIWATGRNAVEGEVLENVSVVRHDDVVAVFGAAGSGYAEAFDAKTGKVRFRFSTSYWEHWSEAWKWRRKSVGAVKRSVGKRL